jgi:hypothetical protein
MWLEFIDLAGRWKRAGQLAAQAVREWILAVFEELHRREGRGQERHRETDDRIMER